MLNNDLLDGYPAMRANEKKSFENVWMSIVSTLQRGEVVKNWGVSRGFTGNTFVIEQIQNTAVTVIGGKLTEPRSVSKRDFEKVYEVWDDYVAGNYPRAKMTDLSQNTTYILSVLRLILGGTELPLKPPNTIVAGDLRIILDQEVELDTIASVQFNIDRFGKISSLEVDDTWNESSGDELRERVADALDYPDGYDQEDILIMWSFTTDAFSDGGFAVSGRLPSPDHSDEDEISVFIPPSGLRGVKMANWLEDVGEERAKGSDRDSLFSSMQASALWLLSRVIRGEPVLRVGTEWNDVELLTDRRALSLNINDSNESTQRSLNCLRVRLTPEGPSSTSTKSRQYSWPCFELDILVQQDGYASLRRVHRGLWYLSEDDTYKGLVELDDEGRLYVYSLEDAVAIWPTNIGARSIADRGTCAIWQTGWQSSCGYSMQIVGQG
jgi:hypothetical protein